MTFSLCTVRASKLPEMLELVWLQDHIGTVETAIARATAVSGVNGNIPIAVFPSIGHVMPGTAFSRRKEDVIKIIEGSTIKEGQCH